jgi:hypothetical protein
MNNPTRLVLAALMMSATLQAPPAAADVKGLSPNICTPYAPGTTAAELQMTQAGVYNPGTATEKILCPLPRDMELNYATTRTLQVTLYYRVLGATDASVTCTVFIGSPGQQSDPVLTATASGPLANNGERTSMTVMFTSNVTTPFEVVPNNMICTVPAKTQIASMLFQENAATD